MITAKEIMNPETPTLSYEATVMDAIQFFREKHCGFALVQATSDRVQGVLTEANLMRAFIRFQSQKAKELIILYRDCLEPLQLIHKDEDFSAVVKKVMTAVGNRVFVIDGEGKVIGFIMPRDVLPTLVGQKKLDHPDLNLYESFFTKSPFMMHSISTDGHIQMANEILHAVLGYEYGELIGKTIFDLYPQEYHESAKEGLKTILSDGYHKTVRSQMVHKNRSLIEVELVSKILMDDHSKRLGTITVSRPLDMDYLVKCLPQI